MEHAQREKMKQHIKLMKTSLNPYFNGTCSKSIQRKVYACL